MSAQIIDNSGLDPMLWAKHPRSSNAIDAVFSGANTSGALAEIRDKLIADGICSEKGQAEYLWSQVAQKFVRPPWYVRVNHARDYA